ncbi:MAG: hypothetical protein MJ204_00170 [Bacteroidales bacterium]|nr:hypothetical protein [Bacteroidales bacterium]
MKKVLLFLGSALLTMSLSAQVMTLSHNEWSGEDGDHQNSQGMLAVTPSMDIQAGYKVVVEFQGTTSGADVTFSSIVVDTTAGGWNVVSSWGSTSVNAGVIVGTVAFTATDAVAGPTLVLSTTDGDNSYDDVAIEFSKVTCTVSDPNYKDPNVTTDNVTVNLLDLNCSWGASSYNAADSTITFEKAWTGQGWAWWGTGLDITDYKSITLEFEATDGKVQLWAQQLPDGVTDESDLLSGKAIAEVGETSVTLNFYDDIFSPAEKGMIGQICVQTENAGILKLKAVYLTYESDEETAVAEVSKNVQIANGVVYSAGKIAVYNLAGAKVAEANGELNMAALQAGVYVIQTAEGTAKYVK